MSSAILLGIPENIQDWYIDILAYVSKDIENNTSSNLPLYPVVVKLHPSISREAAQA
jgi:hypothetical protein